MNAELKDRPDSIRQNQTKSKRVRVVAQNDGLPADGFWNRPPMRSLYHTLRAEQTRQAISRDFPEEVGKARKLLIDAGLGRKYPQHADVADHNAMTFALALRYADCGLSAIDSHAIDPVTGLGTGFLASAKTPRGSKWQERATSDPSILTAFWTADGHYPPNKDGISRKFAPVYAPRNVSIVLQEGSGLFVLDIDGEAGKEALAGLIAANGELPHTAKSITGSGGWHFLFHASRTIRNSASAIGGYSG